MDPAWRYVASDGVHVFYGEAALVEHTLNSGLLEMGEIMTTGPKATCTSTSQHQTEKNSYEHEFQYQTESAVHEHEFRRDYNDLDDQAESHDHKLESQRGHDVLIDRGGHDHECQRGHDAQTERADHAHETQRNATAR
ncbi:hypothetical protein PInf_023470 [Phytophthora infestans]|nr:hypothetical protein PInf_023470 [Phytophthora infestans]